MSQMTDTTLELDRDEPYTPTEADWAEYAEYLASLPESLPTPEDFADVTPERRAAILAECGGDPFGG
jgi:hypothetical protein